MPDLTRHAFVVYTKDPAEPDADLVEDHVTVTIQDRLRVEQVATRLGMPALNEAPQTHAALWCWAALRRTQRTEHTAEHWLNQVLVDMNQDKEAEQPVDPTRPTAGTP